MVTDISEPKECLKKHSRKSERGNLTIVETAPGMLVICDTSGRNLLCAALNCKNITGYTQEELLRQVCLVGARR